MFQEGNYDKIVFQMPPKGMNQFISPEALPPDFCYYLENILPTPIGEGQVRFGDRFKASLGAADVKIIEEFPFIKEDGSRQNILYVQSYVQDNSATDIVVYGNKNIGFNSENAKKYVIDSTIKIDYSLNDANYTLYSQIAIATIENDVYVNLQITGNLFPNTEGINVLNISYANGSIYAHDVSSNQISDVLISGLSVACIPRYAYFQQTLTIVNGIDKNLSWDGESIKEVVDFVKEIKGQGYVRDNDNNFHFTMIPGFNANKYFAGNEIQLKVNGTITELTLVYGIVNDNLFDIRTVQDLPEFAGGDNVELFYQDWPPPFNYIFAGTDRLWALGPGAAGINFRERDQALRAYYSYLPNTTTKWFNENTKTVPSIDMSDKHGITDNFEAIAQVNGLTAFIGRERTQVWSGSIPIIRGRGDFRWKATIPIGIVHGNLLIQMPNDFCFISTSGFKTAGTLNVAKQFAATSLNAIDPIIQNFLSTITGSNIDYRACRSFKYTQGKIAGFKIGQNKLLVSLFENDLYAWTFFSGDFQKAQSFVDNGNSFYFSIDNEIYQYADGNDGSNKVYADNDGKGVISFVWIPKIYAGNRRFANKFYNFILNYPSEFAYDDKNKIYMTINAEIPRQFSVDSECTFQKKGDSIETAPIPKSRLSKNYNYIFKKLIFVSSGFWVKVNGYAVSGPISFNQLKLFGIGERRG